MEETISTLSKTLGPFCNHLETSVDAIKQSLDRRPIPLDSASSTFIQCLNRRLSAATGDLNLLQSMSMDTVSFEELLGHCNQLLKQNQDHLIQLHDRLKTFGYVPDVDTDEDDEASDSSTHVELDVDLPQPSSLLGRADSIIRILEEDPLLDESLSLKSLGISDVSLATLASQANGEIVEPDFSSKQPMQACQEKLYNMEGLHQPATLCKETKEDTRVLALGDSMDHHETKVYKSALRISKHDFEDLPSYLKGLVSWEELLVAVEKINAALNQKKHDHFLPDEISSLELGPKARSYLLLLVRMKLLVVETVDGLISYRVLQL